MDTCVYASWKWATNRRMKKKTEKEGEFGLKLRKEMWRELWTDSGIGTLDHDDWEMLYMLSMNMRLLAVTAVFMQAIVLEVYVLDWDDYASEGVSKKYLDVWVSL